MHSVKKRFHLPLYYLPSILDKFILARLLNNPPPLRPNTIEPISVAKRGANRDFLELSSNAHSLSMLATWINCYCFKHKPIEYILGRTRFMTKVASNQGGLYNDKLLAIKCKPPIMIPRWETEWWVNELIKEMIDAFNRKDASIAIADVCCGSGVIGIALAKALALTTRQVKILFLDNDPKALELTKQNCALNGLFKKPFLDLQFLSSFDDLKARNVSLDLIVANPPYILPKTPLPPSVLRWESPNALFDCADIYKDLTKLFIEQFNQNNSLKAIFEIGYLKQALFVEKEIKQVLYDKVKVSMQKDLVGQPRIISINRRQQSK